MSDEGLFDRVGGGARVNRAFAFVDLSGFTSFTDAEGDAEAVEVLGLFRGAVREISGAHAVRVAKWLGDGAMIVGLDEARLIRAIVDLETAIDRVKSPLPVRGGLASGRVLLFEGDDYIGSAVNLAARLCDLAAPHEVLATESIAAQAVDGVRISHLGDYEIPGISQPVPIVRLELIGPRGTSHSRYA